MSTETQQKETVITESQITLSDFILMSNIISTIARRGGFESKEFTIVGDLATRLDTFIAQHTPVAEPEQSSADADQLELPLDTSVNP